MLDTRVCVLPLEKQDGSIASNGKANFSVHRFDSLRIERSGDHQVSKLANYSLATAS